MGFSYSAWGQWFHWFGIEERPGRLALVAALPAILARNLATIPYYALRGQGRVILKSKIDVMKGLPRMLKKRRDVVRRYSGDEISRFICCWAEIKRH